MLTNNDINITKGNIDVIYLLRRLIIIKRRFLWLSDCQILAATATSDIPIHNTTCIWNFTSVKLYYKFIFYLYDIYLYKLLISTPWHDLTFTCVVDRCIFCINNLCKTSLSCFRKVTDRYVHTIPHLQ